MKTRYTPLVQVKKNIMQKSERALQNANATLNTAFITLDISRQELDSIAAPQSGFISDFLSSRALLDAQRVVIRANENSIQNAEYHVKNAKEQLKLDMIEFEKYNYLELQEIKKIEYQHKLQEAKDLDEIALMTYAKKQKK